MYLSFRGKVLDLDADPLNMKRNSQEKREVYIEPIKRKLFLSFTGKRIKILFYAARR